jgi:hypothetical protein
VGAQAFSIPSASHRRAGVPRGRRSGRIGGRSLRRLVPGRFRQRRRLLAQLIGIEYEDKNYGGSSLTVTGSVTCNGYYHYLASMPSGWDNVISSARAYSGCTNSYHYQYTNSGGSVMSCRDA